MSSLPRRSYSVRYKLAAIDLASQLSTSQVATMLNIHKSMINRWKAMKPLLELCNKHCRHVGKSGRTVSFPQHERTLLEWIKQQRNNKLIVTRAHIRSKMIALTRHETTAFKASRGWLDGFMNRNSLSLRQITRRVSASSPSLSSSGETLDDTSKVDRFRSFVETHCTDMPYQDIINVDQTPVWSSMGCTGKTVERRGETVVKAVGPPGSSNHEKATVILACSQNGHKLAPSSLQQLQWQHCLVGSSAGFPVD